ncbi:MAG: hypothetical protein AAB922_06400 [Patescibacteria group bacterium]
MTTDFLQTLILLLLGLLFFKENLLSWINKKFGFGNGEEKPHWAAELEHYFNHETTGILREIRDSQTNMCKKMDKAINMLENQDKYGIKIRK